MTAFTLRKLTSRTALVVALAVASFGAATAWAKGPIGNFQQSGNAMNVQWQAEVSSGTNAWTATEYQVEFRHPTETNNEWRVSIAWTTDYTYAKASYDYLVQLKIYDVRLYRR